MMLKLSDQLLYGFAMEAAAGLHGLASEESNYQNLEFPLMHSLVSADFFIVELLRDRVKSLNSIEKDFEMLRDRVFCDMVPANQRSFGFPVANGAQIPPLVNAEARIQNPAANEAQVGFVMANRVQENPPWVGQVMEAGGFRDSHNAGDEDQDIVTKGAKVQCSLNTEAEVPLLMADGVRVPSKANSEAATRNLAAEEAKVGFSMANGVQPPSSLVANRARDANGARVVPETDRALFVTFCRGQSSISEAELRDLITRKFGRCVESMRMGDLFAIVVVDSASTLKSILGGNDGLVKLCCKGNEVWLKRFYTKKQLINNSK